MRTVDRTPFLARPRTRRRVRIVQPAPRRASAGRGPTHDRPSTAASPGGEPTAPGGPAPRATPEDATLRALFRVAAAAVARRGEAKP